MYTNIRGLKGKTPSLTAILHEQEPHIFLLTETLLKSNTGLKIKGYTMYSRVRNSGTGGGVAILVRNDVLKHVAPHISDRDTELIWVSIRRKQQPPIFIGSYYGKQESRTSKDEIEREMILLQEEITEMKNEGEIFLAMDGNAKLGILGEPTSRNGKLLDQVINNMNLTLMNTNAKCKGKITRQNTNNTEEYSAIDFIVVSEQMEKWVDNMTIDEDGLLKVKGKKETDHNTITSTLSISHIDHTRVVKRTNWNLRASSEKWANFADELEQIRGPATDIITRKNLSVNDRYRQWYKMVDSTARRTIGKTTTKTGGKEKFSKEVDDLCKQKREIKKQICMETERDHKSSLITTYKSIQESIKTQMTNEKSQQIEGKFKKIIADKSRNAFWKEKRLLSRNPVLEALVIKNEKGQRLFSPEEVKEGTVSYYQNLYKKKVIEPLPYHTEVENSIVAYVEDRQFELEPYNALPTPSEISTILANKKNGKSTTDFKNEMLKRPGKAMENLICPLIHAIWEEESVPTEWNKGLITSLWKGKGDKEQLSNHRGITVSSAFGTIVEELIDNRIEKQIPLTQAQGGGKKQSSTFDHLFILRAMMAISIKEKRETFITFFDVSKAFDTVDNHDMLKIMWDKGIRGKTWRILKNLNSELKAAVKTRYGTTDEIDMEVGGRQGSRLTGRMFSKLMDLLAEEIIASGEGFKMMEDFIIGVLLWVDDVISSVEGYENQKQILARINRFAKNHKLKWGQSKCKVMRIGQEYKPEEFDLGDMKIETCDKYTYLGDVVTPDGKNTQNIKSRKNKINATSISINTIAESEVLHKIETPVLLELHESTNIPSLITNSESWTLLKSEEKEVEQAEIQCLKGMFDLPLKTPTTSIIYTFGTLYTNIRIDQKKLMYLHKILNRDSTHWTKKSFHTLERYNIGWYKSIIKTLDAYEIPNDLDQIKRYSPNEWRNIVRNAVEKQNRTRLIDECHKNVEGIPTPKTKSAHIIPKLNDTNYTRKPLEELSHLSKREAKTLIIARYGMLECGRNFKGTQSEQCITCCCIDDEEHRLNVCPLYSSTNYNDYSDKIKFETIFSNNIVTIREILPRIANVWNTKIGQGSMNVT